MKCRQRLQRVILEKKKEMDRQDNEIWTEDFSKKPIGFIKRFIKKYGYELEKLYKDTGVAFININFLCHAIEFQGDKDSLLKCKDAILNLIDEMGNSMMKSTIIKSDKKQKVCPICFDDLETTSHQLKVCSHSYCIECFSGMCRHAIQNKDLPFVCAEEGCSARVSIYDLIEVIEPKDIVPVTVEKFVASHKDTYKYCVTPDCLNIYRASLTPNPDEPFHCMMCEIQICTFCHKENHHGSNCIVS